MTDIDPAKTVTADLIQVILAILVSGGTLGEHERAVIDYVDRYLDALGRVQWQNAEDAAKDRMKKLSALEEALNKGQHGAEQYLLKTAYDRLKEREL